MQQPRYANQQLDTVIVWFRRDLRTYDNPALVAALQAARNVIPVFIWSPEEEGQFQPGRFTRWWAKKTVAKFAEQLERMGSRLIVRRSSGESLDTLLALVSETNAQAVFFNHLYDSISMVRDNDVKDALRARGLGVSSFNADVLYEPWEVLDADGTPFTTFKRFWDKVLAMHYPPPLPLPEPLALPRVDAQLSSLDLSQVDFFMTPEQEASTDALQHRWRPGTEGAHERLEAFLASTLPSFEFDRAKTDRESTTQLSPWVHLGSISVRYIYYRVAQVHSAHMGSSTDISKSCLDFLQQVGYREYSRYLSFHFPFITERSMLAHLRACPFRRDAGAFKAWRQGLTGYPLIDAGMRQLWATGWCHNRVRVVAASFMVKNLLLPWQWGLKHLWDCQIDADLECDALGWQYVAGCLADAHPFSHMIDLESEWQRFDPTAEYVRRWLPVLARLPPQWAQQPWKAPAHVLQEAGVELGFNYPRPLVSMDAARSGVARASSIIERCTTTTAGGNSSSGNSTGSVLPRKEPYRPATDPAALAIVLGAAAGEFDVWELQQRLPGLELLEPRIKLVSGGAGSGSADSSGAHPSSGTTPPQKVAARMQQQQQKLLTACTTAAGSASAPSGASSGGDSAVSDDEDMDEVDSSGGTSSGEGSGGSSCGSPYSYGSQTLLSGGQEGATSLSTLDHRRRRSGGRRARAASPGGSFATGASALRPWADGEESAPMMDEADMQVADTHVVPDLDAGAKRREKHHHQRRRLEAAGSVRTGGV